MEYQLREAAASDIPELCRLRLAYFDEEFDSIEPETLGAIRTSLPEYFAAHLGKDCFVFAAASPEGGLLSNVILVVSEKPANPSFPHGRSGYVLGVFTEEFARRQGIASALMQMLLEKAKALRLDTVTLSASEMGRGIYEKLGFTVKESHFTEMEWFPS